MEKAAEDVLKLVREKIRVERTPVEIFGKGHKQRLSEMWGITNTVSLPVMEQVSASGDSGTPHLLNNPDSTVSKAFKNLAGEREVFSSRGIWSKGKCR